MRNWGRGGWTVALGQETWIKQIYQKHRDPALHPPGVARKRSPSWTEHWRGRQRGQDDICGDQQGVQRAPSSGAGEVKPIL